MKRTILLIITLLSFLQNYAQDVVFSDSAVISLITCSPGPEVYAKFGHTGIRIKDAKKGIDVIFNYGLFNFETKDFYLKFIKGETDYQLGVNQTEYFLPEYASRNSMVWEQVLNLTVPEKRNLINLLLENYKPENRIYRYNFVFDNCATRPRDKIFEALRGYVKMQNNSETKTFRQWIGIYTGTDTWLKFGIDLVFGIDADRTATQNESMFLPEVLMNEFQNAQIGNPNSTTRKLVNGDKIILVNSKNEPETRTFWLFKPFGLSILLLIIGTGISLWDYSRKRVFKPFDTAVLILTGLGGVVIAFLMIFSIHPLVKINLNILWLNPLNLILAVFVWIRKWRMSMFFYEIINIVLLVSALFAFALSWQIFNDACFPLIVLLIIRTTSWFAITKKRIFKHRDLR